MHVRAQLPLLQSVQLAMRRDLEVPELLLDGLAAGHRGPQRPQGHGHVGKHGQGVHVLDPGPLLRLQRVQLLGRGVGAVRGDAVGPADGTVGGIGPREADGEAQPPLFGELGWLVGLDDDLMPAPVQVDRLLLLFLLLSGDGALGHGLDAVDPHVHSARPWAQRHAHRPLGVTVQRDGVVLDVAVLRESLVHDAEPAVIGGGACPDHGAGRP
mmetsp:Transcript_107993/g.186319  ORF Transcript_107993/g.186319 Transcript_107993/m.186319 type:complete len:212 (+) Transcript_107993:558-1193(+)